ncbi:alpha/beta fold hydrolase, partial [Pseudonocardia pini]|uniref:alpha/beta fold hydrolase n=1 Tax=Pseudonocardia pini TaxID=2758030 RepID=UPI001C6929D5
MEIDTGIGPVHVEVEGSGPPALLWHSLFLDLHQWDLVRPALAAHRTLVLLDGPGHGRGGRPPRRFTFDGCADAAAHVLRTLDLGPEVDWVGNAWGGHVGYVFAARYPLRSLTAISAPPTPLPAVPRR